MKCQDLLSLKNKNKFLKMFSAAVVIGDLTLCMLGNFACFFVICRFFFYKLIFQKKKKKKKNSYRNTTRVSKSLDPDQA